MKKGLLALVALAGFVASSLTDAVSAPLSPVFLHKTNNVKTVSWPRPVLPAWETNRLLVGTTVTNMTAVPNFSVGTAGYTYTTTNVFPQQFYGVHIAQKSSNDLLIANVLNRLAYGPTPDDLERLALIGPQAYIDEQLAPETLVNPVESYSSLRTNSVSLPPNSNFTTVTVTGTVSSSTLYMYLVSPATVYLDNIELRYSHVFTGTTNYGGALLGTNAATNLVVSVRTNVSANLLINGDFELPLTNGWRVSANHALSGISADYVGSGATSLKMVATAGGNTQGSSIWQTNASLNAIPVAATVRGTNGVDIYTNTIATVRAILTYSYLPSQESDRLVIRLSGTGLIIGGADQPAEPEWIYATATGTADPDPYLYLYLSDAGEANIDNIKLVAGSVAEAGPNLLQNGSFESPLAGSWILDNNHTGSVIDNTVALSGAASLRLVAAGAGSGNFTNGNNVLQVVSGLTNGQTYTVSYWYRPATRSRTITVRLSGSALLSTPDSLPGNLTRRLDAANWGVSLTDLRRWFGYNAVSDPRQLIEVLSQFFENHFVTYYSKTADYFDRYYDGLQDRIATDLEYREMSRWRAALLNPNCTFYDLLKIHAESPAQIIYLDTVESRGDGTRIANENYGRELFELYCMGVDNGYDQFDITVMSRAWTGWSVGLVRREEMNNPFAPFAGNNPDSNAKNVLQYGLYPGVGYDAVSNIVGVWTFVYIPSWHGTNRAPILSVWDTNSPATNPKPLGGQSKTYPARFGPPWAGRPYSINLPARTGNGSIQDGYDVITALSTNICTAEYLSIKLCRLFVHDNFPNPTTRPELPEFAYYNYTNPNRTPEAELVRQCITAWDTAGPDGRKGNIRSVLRTIFNSELFRSHGGSMQKVKTPLEFVVSAMRALKSTDAAGISTVFTDGNFESPLSRMGLMSLFNRAEPDGYPETAAPWISAGTLAERLRYVQTFCMDTAQPGGRPGDAGAQTVDPVMLLQRKLNNSQWLNASAVADLIVSYLYPGEGKANLDLYRQAAVDFLNNGSADPAGNNTSTRNFSQLTVSASATSSYDLRVRGMVSMLMTLQRFQEQ
jgi:uncharacterized protein (DUF1800 family)